MPLYTFTLEEFHIDNTRSRHEDTDVVTFGLQVGERQFPILTFSAGDVNNGDHPVNLSFPSVFIGDSVAPVVFCYQIYNGDASKLSVSLSAMTANLTSQAINSLINDPKPEPASPADYTNFPSDDSPTQDGNIDFTDGSWIRVLQFVTLASFIFPDCDGFVAIGTIGNTKSQWDQNINSASNNIFRRIIRYPGTDSPAGCGSNSDYTVTWSVTREIVRGPWPFSLRTFLQTHQVTLDPGLRSLDPSKNSRISLKALIGFA